MPEESSQPQFDTGAAYQLKKPYLDSSVFLAHIKQEKILCLGGKNRYEITSRIFNDAEADKFIIYTSTVTIAEVRRIKKAKKKLTEDERKTVNVLFKKYMQHEWMYPIEVSREVAEKAQGLGATYSLTPIDSIHVASAILWECDMLLVWDKHTLLNKFPNGIIEGVRICEPYWEGLPKMIEP